MYSNGVRCERDGLFEVVEGSLLRQQTPLPTGSRYLLRKAIFVERLLGDVCKEEKYTKNVPSKCKIDI